MPLGSAAALRVAAYNTAIGGFVDAVQPDPSVRENVDGGRRTGARVAVLLQSPERLSFTTRLVYQDVSINTWNPFTTTRPAVSLEDLQQFTQIDERFADRFVLGDLTAEIDFGDLVLTQITSVTYCDVQVVRDASALGGSVSFSLFGAPEAGYTLDFSLVNATTAEGVTQEIRLAGGGERLDWVFGSVYGASERRYGQSAYAKDYVAVNGAAVTDCLRAVTGIPDLVWSGSRPLAGHPDTEELFFSDLDYDLEQLAFFGEATVAVTDRLSLTGGLRWYNFDEERTQVFDGLFADPSTARGPRRRGGSRRESSPEAVSR